jgi:hypothetical protein
MFSCPCTQQRVAGLDEASGAELRQLDMSQAICTSKVVCQQHAAGMFSGQVADLHPKLCPIKERSHEPQQI